MPQQLHAWLEVNTAVPGPPGLPRAIHDEGVPLPVREIIDMRGAGVTATDDAANDTTIITIPGAAAGTVVSVFGRPGPLITAQAGDYTAAQVTNAVSVLGSYSDPAWITSIDWSKVANEPASFPPSAHTHDWTTEITGKPASFPPSVHVHAAADVTSGVFAAGRLGTGTPSASNYLRGDGAWTALTATQVSGVVPDTRQVIAGTGLSGGGALSANVTLNANIAGIQTPWTQDINGAGFVLTNASRIESPLIRNSADIVVQCGSGNPERLRIGALQGNVRCSANHEIDVNRYYCGNVSWDGSDWRYLSAGRGFVLTAGVSDSVFYTFPAGTAGAVGISRMEMAFRSSGQIDFSDSFSAVKGSVIIRAQTAPGLEGGELALNDYDDTEGWKFDTYNRNLRIFRGATIVFQADNGTAAIKMYLGGTLKTLSVDASGFVKAA